MYIETRERRFHDAVPVGVADLLYLSRGSYPLLFPVTVKLSTLVSCRSI